jgi:hypothetical protein
MQRSNESRFVGARGLEGSGHRSKTFGPGRLCGELGCGTRLSIYNDGSYCSRHQAKDSPKMRGKRVVRADMADVSPDRR